MNHTAVTGVHFMSHPAAFRNSCSPQTPGISKDCSTSTDGCPLLTKQLPRSPNPFCMEKAITRTGRRQLGSSSFPSYFFTLSFSQLEQWRSEPSLHLHLFLLQGHRVAPRTHAGDKASCHHRSWLFLSAAGCPAVVLVVLLAFCIIHDVTESGHSQKQLQPLHCCPGPCRQRVLQQGLPGQGCV